MNATDTNPITTHLREAAEQIRAANHATFTDRREVTDLYHTLGALCTLLERLPQLVAHLRNVCNADPATYYHDQRGDVTQILRIAYDRLHDLHTNITALTADAYQAFNVISHLGTRRTP